MYKKQVIQALGITEKKYNTMYFDAAMAYLDAMFDGHESIRGDMHQTPAFWNWWKNQYDLLDEQIIRRGVKVNLEQYYDLHVFLQHLPDRVIYRSISDGYNQMISEVIKEATRKVE